jgi:hypothetical protein
MSFPRFTWVACECGCGYEGEDPVAQWQLEDALMYRLELQERPDPAADALARSLERRERQ